MIIGNQNLRWLTAILKEKLDLLRSLRLLKFRSNILRNSLSVCWLQAPALRFLLGIDWSSVSVCLAVRLAVQLAG